ncbi:MAG: hypothetical protein JWP97_5194 [Labilithrix sp.]|nr:hypothetical protein [Labilithrix sp.]
MRGRRAAKIADRGLLVLVALLGVSLTAAAWHDVSKAWDVWYYHLPFAARLVGLVDASSYAFGRANQARFDGFPVLGELLQGLCWRITGRPECASFVSLASLPLLAFLLRRLFDVPIHLTVLALLAVPLVQIHATAAYVDLPANAWVTMLILIVFRHVVDRRAPSLRTMVLAAALAAATANTKFQLVPVVVVASLGLVVVALRGEPGRAMRAVVIALAVPIVFATPLVNLVRRGNPVWPIELRVLGHAFPHTEGAYASTPAWLARVPGPARWAASVLELRLPPIAGHARWSIDQWTPPSGPAYRLGGFFGAWVVANLLAVGLALFFLRTRESKVAACFIAAFSVVASVMPQAHELRYYLFWMLLLVSMALVLWSRRRPLAVGLAALSAFLVVTWSTGFGYVYPSGDSFATLVKDHAPGSALERVAPGERVCVMREPWSFLYAPRFHPGHSYAVQEAEDPTECEGARPLE